MLNVINPKVFKESTNTSHEHCFSQDGTDYWLGGLDADRDQGLQWMSGMEMAFTDFVKDQPNGLPYLHMNFDNQFK